MSNHCCSQMQNNLAKTHNSLQYNGKFREYGIKVDDGGTSVILITYCPWCAQKLPMSLRDEWFDLIDKLGLDISSELSSERLTESWWKSRGR
ncbi:MAG: DUF6980 family protein [Shewanella sp.]